MFPDYVQKNQAVARLTAVVILFSLLLSGCARIKRTPDLNRIFAGAKTQTGKRPLIIIPGILGSELVNKETNEVVWATLNRAKDDDLSLPISPDLSQNTDDLVPRDIVRSVRVVSFLPEIGIYQQLIQALQTYAGYTEGSWGNPAADGDKDTFYLYAYDWRRDNVENARRLIQQVKDLKKKLKRPDLKFNIVAHSMGGLIARYAAMYGDADLPPEGTNYVPNWAGADDFAKIFLIGTPNEGSYDAFNSLVNGYSIGSVIFSRNLTRSDVFTIASLYQLLPQRGTSHFLDENLKPLELDLYDPKVWQKYNWGAIGEADLPATQNKKEKEDSAIQKPLDKAQMDAYLPAVLNRARRFHEALDARVSSRAPVLMFVIGGDCEPTLSSPVIYKDAKTDQWQTLFRAKSFKRNDGQKVSVEELRKAMYAPGDGLVTRRSLLAETLAENGRRSQIFDTALPINYALFLCEAHDQLTNNASVQDNFLTALVSEATR
jgi:pimeloyl-ACP methyl ester carboxylesterase